MGKINNYVQEKPLIAWVILTEMREHGSRIKDVNEGCLGSDMHNKRICYNP
jgi:hypothetical protein